jgi:hypothetical protein
VATGILIMGDCIGLAGACVGAVDCADACTICDDLPSTVTVTLPDNSSWGWPSGTSCSPNETIIVVTKQGFDPGYDCLYSATACVGGKTVTVDVGHIPNPGFPGSWYVQFDNGSGSIMVYKRNAAATICDAFGTLTPYLAVSLNPPSTPPATITVS